MEDKKKDRQKRIEGLTEKRGRGRERERERERERGIWVE